MGVPVRNYYLYTQDDQVLISQDEKLFILRELQDEYENAGLTSKKRIFNNTRIKHIKFSGRKSITKNYGQFQTLTIDNIEGFKNGRRHNGTNKKMYKTGAFGGMGRTHYKGDEETKRKFIKL